MRIFKENSAMDMGKYVFPNLMGSTLLRLANPNLNRTRFRLGLANDWCKAYKYLLILGHSPKLLFSALTKRACGENPFIYSKIYGIIYT